MNLSEEDTFLLLKRKFKFGEDLFCELNNRMHPYEPDDYIRAHSFTIVLHEVGWNVTDYFNELVKTAEIDRKMHETCLIIEKELYGN